MGATSEKADLVGHLRSTHSTYKKKFFGNVNNVDSGVKTDSLYLSCAQHPTGKRRVRQGGKVLATVFAHAQITHH